MSDICLELIDQIYDIREIINDNDFLEVSNKLNNIFKMEQQLEKKYTCNCSNRIECPQEYISKCKFYSFILGYLPVIDNTLLVKLNINNTVNIVDETSDLNIVLDYISRLVYNNESYELNLFSLFSQFMTIRVLENEGFVKKLIDMLDNHIQRSDMLYSYYVKKYTKYTIDELKAILISLKDSLYDINKN